MSRELKRVQKSIKRLDNECVGLYIAFLEARIELVSNQVIEARIENKEESK